MERLVYLDQAAEIDVFLQRAAWHRVDGVEVDLTGMAEDAYHALVQAVEAAPVTVRSLHYGRTETIRLQEDALFTSQLDHVIDRAHELGCAQVSVHPPRVEIGTNHTVRDLQEFMRDIDAYAAANQVNLSFLLTGFLKDPQLFNLGFGELDEPALGVSVDLADIHDGVDPRRLLEKLDVPIHKVRFPLSFDEMVDAFTGHEHVAAVAYYLE